MSFSHNHHCERQLSVIVVGSAVRRKHFSDSKGSEWYTNKVVELLTRRGYDVVQRLSALPDEDFRLPGERAVLSAQWRRVRRTGEHLRRKTRWNVELVALVSSSKS